jgi:alpha-galactosidase
VHVSPEQEVSAAMPSRQPKIAMIGAGGVVFPLRLMGDLLAFPAL